MERNPIEKLLTYSIPKLTAREKKAIITQWNEILKPKSKVSRKRNEQVMKYLFSNSDREGVVLGTTDDIAEACSLSHGKTSISLYEMTKAGLITRKAGITFIREPFCLNYLSFK